MRADAFRFIGSLELSRSDGMDTDPETMNKVSFVDSNKSLENSQTSSGASLLARLASFEEKCRAVEGQRQGEMGASRT